MKKSITLRINDPCHEKWSEMTATEKGRFCQVCTKEVIDFTKSSDEEIIKITASGKAPCGRFNASQLNRPLQLKRKTANSWVSYAASLLMPLSIMANHPHPNSKETNFSSLGIGSRTGNMMKSIIKVSGTVYDQDALPVAGAAIYVNGEPTKTFTDSNGYFELKCPSQSKIYVEWDGILSEEFSMGSMDKSITFQLDFSQKDSNTGQTVVIVECPSIVAEENSCEKETEFSGTVIDEDGIPLPGVNVIINGTSLGTQTDFDGNFSIGAKVGQHLQFSYVGYETQSIIVSLENLENPISMKLYEGAWMGEVVVVGMWVSHEDATFTTNAHTPSPYNYYQESEQRLERQAYEAKVKAWNDVKKARKRAQRKLKRK